MKTQANTLDLKKWECMIPGKEKTIWDGANLKLEMTFPEGMCASTAFWVVAPSLRTKANSFT